MKELFEKGRWLLFILPGFAAFATARFLSNMADVSDYEKTILFFGISVMVYVALFYLWHGILRARSAEATIEDIFSSPGLHIVALVIACSLGIGIAILYEKDVARDIARSVFGKNTLPRASSHATIDVLFRSLNTSDRNKIVDFRAPVLRFNGTTVLVAVNDRLSYSGVPMRWSSRGEDLQVYLSPACTVTNGNTEAVIGPGVWLPLSGVKSISFLDRNQDKCSKIFGKLRKSSCMANFGSIFSADCKACNDSGNFATCMCGKTKYKSKCIQCTAEKNVRSCVKKYSSHKNKN